MKNNNEVASLLTDTATLNEARNETLRVLPQLRREVGGEHPRSTPLNGGSFGVGALRVTAVSLCPSAEVTPLPVPAVGLTSRWSGRASSPALRPCGPARAAQLSR